MQSDSSKSNPRSSSENTRRRLLDVGLEEFGKYGFDYVSTRQLTQKAQVNQAAIPYHFGGKEGLYMAVAEDLVATLRGTVGIAAERIQKRLESGPIPLAEGEILVTALIGKMVPFLVGTGNGRLRAAFVIRELMNPSEAFDHLYQGYLCKVHTTVTRLVASLLAEDPEAESSILRAHALIGQVMVFGAGRELIRVRMGWKETTEEHLEQIRESITETFIASIRSMRSQRNINAPNPPNS